MGIRKPAVVMAFLALTLALSTAAIAAHQFVDVPDNHVFHDDIAWLADNDVTVGCNPPANDEFCPEDNVTRGQMAAFLHRFADNVAGEDGVVGPQGPAGPAGPQGEPGQDGADGVDGIVSGLWITGEDAELTEPLVIELGAATHMLVAKATVVTGANQFTICELTQGETILDQVQLPFTVFDDPGRVTNAGIALTAFASGDVEFGCSGERVTDVSITAVEVANVVEVSLPAG